MAISYQGQIGSASSKTAGTSLAITLSSGANVGDLLVVLVALDNQGSTQGETTAVSVSDDQGNTYTRRAEYTVTGGSPQDGVTVGIFECIVSNALSASDVITIAHSNVVSRAGIVERVTGNDLTYYAYGNSGGTGASPSQAANGNSGENSIWFVAVGQEYAGGDYSADTGDGWTALTEAGTSGGGPAGNIQIYGAYKTSTAASEQDDPALAHSADYAHAVVSWYEASSSVNGQADITFGVTTLAGLGILPIDGQADITFGVMTLDGLGTVPQGEIENIDHEAGDLNEYNTTSGDVAADAAAALVGSYGMQVDISSGDSEQDRADTNTLSVNTTKFNFRFYFDINSLAMPAGGYINLALIVCTGTVATYLGVVRIEYTGSAYEISVGAIDDNDSVTWSTDVGITDGIHFIEGFWERATSSTASDGTVTWWIDGVEQTGNDISGIDNYDNFPTLDFLRIGQCGRTGSSVYGTIYIDDVIIRDDGQYIGPASTSNDGQADITFGAMTLAGLGTVPINGQADITFGAMTLAGLGDLPVNGQADITFGGMTFAGLGTVGAQANNGTADITFGAMTLAGLGELPVNGQADIVFGDMTLEGLGTLPVDGQADITFGDMTLQGAGSVNTQAINGAADITFGAMTLDGSGTLPIDGQADIVFEAMVLAGLGTLPIDGQADITFGAMTLVGAGTVVEPFSGTVELSLYPDRFNLTLDPDRFSLATERDRFDLKLEERE